MPSTLAGRRPATPAVRPNRLTRGDREGWQGGSECSSIAAISQTFNSATRSRSTEAGSPMVEVQAQRRRDLLGEEAASDQPARVDAADQLALIASQSVTAW